MTCIYIWSFCKIPLSDLSVKVCLELKYPWRVLSVTWECQYWGGASECLMLPDIETLNTGPATLVTCQARLGQTNNWTETCKILPRLADVLFKTSWKTQLIFNSSIVVDVWCFTEERFSLWRTEGTRGLEILIREKCLQLKRNNNNTPPAEKWMSSPPTRTEKAADMSWSFSK